MAGPWLRDKDGNPVGLPFGREVSVEHSVSGTALDFLSGPGRVVDDADTALRNTLATFPGAIQARANANLFDDLATEGERVREGGGNPFDPESNPTVGRLVLLAMFAVGLYLLAPIINLAATVLDDG